MGAVSEATALPDYVRPAPGTRAEPPTVWWPDGDKSRIAFVRATAIRTAMGDLRPEVLGIGHAIIHDKIIVNDPLDPDGCAVITGSHNLGFKASYASDENLLIITGNRDLAIAYAVHVIDIYDHYLTRARIEDPGTSGPGAPPAHGGFLKPGDSWQDRFAGPPAGCLGHFLGAV